MARAVEQIERDIAALDQAVVAMAQTYQQAYQEYLAALGTAIRQQLILAAYHLCTHGYPEAFLKLSLTQRQELQQALKQIGKQAQTQLLQTLPAIQPGESLQEADLDASDVSLQITDVLTEELLSQAAFELQNLEDADPTDDLEDDLEENPEENLEENPDNDSALETVAAASVLEDPTEVAPSRQPFDFSQFADPVVVDRALLPKDIARWQARLEKSISLLLQDLSHQANRVLQQAQILSHRLPEPVLEVATKADLSSDMTANSPNLLNLLIESEGEGAKPSMTQVIAIRLRLSEIEFGDAATAAQRAKLRQLINQLTKLGRDYQRKQKEYAVAQAEAAWRSSWYDPED